MAIWCTAGSTFISGLSWTEIQKWFVLIKCVFAGGVCHDVSIFLRAGGLLVLLSTKIPYFCMLLYFRACQGAPVAAWSGGVVGSWHPIPPCRPCNIPDIPLTDMNRCATRNLCWNISLLLHKVSPSCTLKEESARDSSAEKAQRAVRPSRGLTNSFHTDTVSPTRR